MEKILLKALQDIYNLNAYDDNGNYNEELEAICFNKSKLIVEDALNKYNQLQEKTNLKELEKILSEKI